MGKAIVLGGDNVGLNVVRTLAKAGVQAMAIFNGEPGFAYFSRFISQRVRLAFPLTDSVRLLSCLMRTPEEWDSAVLIPANDSALVFLSQNREVLKKRYIPAVTEWEIIKKIINKGFLYREASRLGIPLPKILFLSSIAELIQRKNEIVFPCLLKPCETHKFFPLFRKKLLVVQNFEELIDKFSQAQSCGIEVMVVEIIPGPDSCLYNYRSYHNRQGELVAEMCTQKIRQHPPGFGVGRVVKTVPIMPELKEFSLRMLNGFSYHGFSCAEFKYDYRDKQYKLMEINTRPVLPERLFAFAGINFTYINYLDYTTRIPKLNFSYEPDRYWIDNLADLEDFFRYRKLEKLTLYDYLRPYLKKKVFCLSFLDDPLPFLIKSWFFIIRLTRRFFRKFFG